MKNDIKRLGNLLIDKLRDILQFTEGHLRVRDNLFDNLEITSRQKQRAIDITSEGEIFWDRVSNNIIIPIEDFYILLTDVRLNIDIYCQELFLKILKDAIYYRLTNLRSELLNSTESNIPDYTKYAIQEIINEKINAYLFYIEFNNITNKVEYDIFLSRILLNKNFEYVGNNKNSYFFLVYDLNIYEINKIIDNYNLTKVPKRNIKRFIIYPLNRFDNLEELIFNFNYIKNLSRLLSLQITSFDNLYKFFNFIGIDISDNSYLLKFVSQILKLEEIIKNNKESFFLVFVNNDTDFPKDIQDLSFSLNNEFAILYKKLDDQTDIMGYVDHFKQMFLDASDKFGGMVYYKEPSSHKNFLMELLCVFIHSKLLGGGSFVLFDNVTMNIIGDEYISLGDKKIALEYYNLALSVNKDDTRVLNSIGATLAEIGQLASAERFLKRGLDIDPNDPSILYNLCGIHLRKNKIDEAERIIEKAYLISSDNIAIITRYAEVLERIGKYQKAYEILLPFFSEENDNLPFLLYKICAKVFYKKGENWKKVRELLNLALKKNPFDEELYLMMALGYWEREGDEKTARLFLQKLKLENIRDPKVIHLYKKIRKVLLN